VTEIAVYRKMPQCGISLLFWLHFNKQNGGATGFFWTTVGAVLMNKLYEKFFAYQLGKPTGLFGRLYMKRFLNEGNQRSNELALKHLGIRPSDRVLEIGFGGGWLIRQIAKLASPGKVVGLDHSKTMVEAARREFRNESNLEFLCGNAESLPFESGSFTHVGTVHTIYFWKDPKRVLEEIYRVLKPGGTLVLGLHSKAKLETQPLTRHNFTLYEPRDVVALLTDSSFQNVTVHSYDPDEWEDVHCLVASKGSLQ